jgi:hypothetical protein
VTKTPSKPKKIRKRDRAEEILDYMYDDRNIQLRRACKKIIQGASRGLAIYEELVEIDQQARQAGTCVLPHPDFLNFRVLLWMLELELASLLDDYIRAKGERRWLYARLLLLSLFESTRTLRSIFTISLRKDMIEKIGPESTNEVSNLHAYIHHASKDLDADYGDTRRRLLAHRDPDATLWFKLLSEINGLEIKDFAWEVLEWLAACALLQQRYMLAIERLNGAK